jgi:gamma-tubulin complex component 2
VVEVPSASAERQREREQRAAKQRSQYSGSAVAVSVRSSDTILLRCNQFQGLFLACGPEGTLELVDGADDFHSRQAPTLTTDSRSPKQWGIIKAPAPLQPTWARERAILNGDYSCRDVVDIGLADRKGKNPAAVMEQQLLDDLLFAMQGISGDYCVRQAGEWRVSEEHVPDMTVRSLAERVLPLCTHYEAVNQFVLKRSRPEYGRVSHALSAAMRKLLREYQVLLAQLEHQMQLGQLSLQKLWFYVQPSLRSLEILAAIAQRVRNSTGGALLNAIHKLSLSSGDPKSKMVYRYLIENAAVPYLEMLELWIYQGVIRDPYEEFMICVDHEASNRTMRNDYNAKYWSLRYTLRERAGRYVSRVRDELVGGDAAGKQKRDGDDKRKGGPSSSKAPSTDVEVDFVPFFLERLAPMVLTTGKYLNVIRECGRWVKNDCQTHIPFHDGAHAYAGIVNTAHDFASRTLLALLLQEEKLIARLGSIKHYFLLDQGDFFVHFMDLAYEELSKKAKDISITRLQSLLEICLRARNMNDPYQEDLECKLSKFSLIQQVQMVHQVGGVHASAMAKLTKGDDKSEEIGLNLFTFDFKVRWPLSLVLSKAALTKYQLIFRHLFYCRHVETRICACWRMQQATKELNLRMVLGPQYALLQRMLHLLQNFQYYVMFEVLEPRWHMLERQLRSVKTVDELMAAHNEFLDTCLRETLLTHPRLLNLFSKLMSTCTDFSFQQEERAKNLDETLRQFDESEARKKLQQQLPLIANVAAADTAPSGKRPPRQTAGEMSKQKRVHRQNRLRIQEQSLRDEVELPASRRTFEQFRGTFDRLLDEFMKELQNEATNGDYRNLTHLKNLCTRLDYNSFYRNGEKK